MRKSYRIGASYNSYNPDRISRITADEMMELSPPVVVEDRGGNVTAVTFSEEFPMAGIWATGDSIDDAGRASRDLAHEFFRRESEGMDMPTDFYDRATELIHTYFYEFRTGPFTNPVAGLFPYRWREKWGLK